MATASKTIDGIQENLTNFAWALDYQDLSPEVIHAAKVRVIDTLSALIGGFFGEPCQIARNLASLMPDVNGATIIGTRVKTTADMAAFVNAITARFVEMNDIYHWPGSFSGHPSDVVTPLLALAEHAKATGPELLTAVLIAYEVYSRLSDVFHNWGFDNANLACIAVAVASGKLLKLSREQLAHCISMATVPNVILRQGKFGKKSMFKAVTAGYAGRAGVFAALLARSGMEGPHLPFEGNAGWCDHVARERFALTLGGQGAPFKIFHSLLKNRSSSGPTISSVLAAEKVAPLRNLDEVQKITVEVYKRAKDFAGTGEHHWNPNSRETADHSGPYVVAATLIDGTISLHSYDEQHLANPQLRALIQKIEYVENPEFSKAFDATPQAHRTRITVTMKNGEKLVGETGGDQDDLAAPRSDAQVADKFHRLAQDVMTPHHINAVLDRLWLLEESTNVATLPAALVFI